MLLASNCRLHRFDQCDDTRHDRVAGCRLVLSEAEANAMDWLGPRHGGGGVAVLGSPVFQSRGIWLCNAPLEVGQEPSLIRRLVEGVCCIGRGRCDVGCCT